LFRDTREHGVWTLWFDSGRKREMKIFQEGRLEGPYAWWHPNGQLRAEGNYKEGKKEGIWIMYDNFGKEEECLTYANGESTD
jgi:antitoxin component YwqK of YwqJK toxin-antitoxin module